MWGLRAVGEQAVGTFSGELYISIHVAYSQRKIHFRGYCPILQWKIFELQRVL